MSKLRLLIGISTAALFAVTASARAGEYYHTNHIHHAHHAHHAAKATNGKSSAKPCVPYGDADAGPQMCATH
jgi:hypothetical protein